MCEITYLIIYSVLTAKYSQNKFTEQVSNQEPKRNDKHPPPPKKELYTFESINYWDQKNHPGSTFRTEKFHELLVRK